ncbi:hypothetical protein HH214_09385 [Mucilaginibacter robiniae]|uniref:Uncharacterized protein n=1 Tax=Mucilaginibacter robiniae TaxID=2728022 RepID=A0A7L5DZ48_9SPHI|nr:hypothetical protein [Mucilaginibacter robiniae]QJD96071.1 hypothetical protein HH214_09385 [Mucilaginibacter robiniae]
MAKTEKILEKAVRLIGVAAFSLNNTVLSIRSTRQAACEPAVSLRL